MQTEEQMQEAVTPTDTEQAQLPAETSTEPGAEQTAEAAEQQAQTEPEKPRNDWVQRRIDQLTRERHEERRQREALEAQLRALQGNPEQTPAAQQQPQDVMKAAEELLRQRDFDSACNKVYKSGKTEFPDFDQALKTFALLGGANREFLEAVTAMDAGHKVMHHLGNNPDVAERILSLSPVRMAVELAKLESTVSKSAPPPQSKAPAPITPIGGKSAPVEPTDFKSTEEYIAWRKANRK